MNSNPMLMSDRTSAIDMTNTLHRYIAGYDTSVTCQTEHLAGAGATFLLEKKLADYTGKKFALTFSSATTALTSLCLAMDIKGAEVITTPVTWGGAVTPFLINGNKLRFSSIEAASLHLDPNQLIHSVNSRTKVVISTDLHGYPADSASIKDFCQANGLKYISDSAQSLGAFRDGRSAGWFADATVLSFSPGKSFFAGEGGAVVTDDPDLYERLIWVSQHPERQKAIFGLSYTNEYAPINGRINPFASLYLNMRFQACAERLRIYQGECHSALNILLGSGLIEEVNQIAAPEGSTYFKFSVRLKRSSTVEDVNAFLNECKVPFQAQKLSVKLIPFDPQFKSQFVGRYSCSNHLRGLTKNGILERRFNLEHQQIS